MLNFWNFLPEKFTVLAPMEDVTDTVFRRVIIKAGRPDVFFTEFTNCEGLQSIGMAKVVHRLKFLEIEKPIVAQVWGITPQDYFSTAKLILEMGFDGMDINMGCPVKKVIRQGAGSRLIKNPNLAKEIVLACKEGLQNKIPLSIKTRLGFLRMETDTWGKFLLSEFQPEALTIHLRTVKEQSIPPAHWEEMPKIVYLNKQISLTKRKSLTSQQKLQIWKNLVTRNVIASLAKT